MKDDFSPWLSHAHTGRHLPHHHTSYPSLIFLLLLAGILIFSITLNVFADTLSVSAKVPGPAPTTTAVITSPTNGQHFSAIPITVSGTCPYNPQNRLLIKLYRNNVFSGSTFCQADSRFSLVTDLFIGGNDLVAREVDNINQAGPDSAVVKVYYDPPAPQLSPSGGSTQTTPGGNGSLVSQLVLTSNQIYRGFYVGEEIDWPIDISGGQTPYAISVDWGDGQTYVISRNLPGRFIIKHVYDRSSNQQTGYRIIIQAADANSNHAQLQLVVIIADPSVAKSVFTTKKELGGKLLIAWPLWIVALLMVISFWLGKWREKEELDKETGPSPLPT